MRLVSLVFLLVPTLLGAQQPGPVSIVHVIVTDSAAGVIGNAEVSVSFGLRQVLATGTTDDSGRKTLAFSPPGPGEIQVTARKIGYRRTDRVFQLGHSDTMTILLAMPRNPVALDTVTITAEAKRKRAFYEIDADAIAASDKRIESAWDVVSQLRPDMLNGHLDPRCGGIQNVFVNGKRIPLAPRPTPGEAMHARASAPLRSRFTTTAVTVLSEIHPEHIAEITYHDCFDTSIAVVGHTQAVFITLKPGVEYEVGQDSFVLPLPANRAP
jgi:hypothetical protein